MVSIFSDVGVCIGNGSVGLNSHPKTSPRLRSCIEAVAVMAMIDPLVESLNSQDLNLAFEHIEMPHLLCLAKMESTGFGLYYLRGK